MADRPLAVVLASGGLDSCVVAAMAARRFSLAMLHADYGQRTEARERAAFAALADHFAAAERLVVELPYWSRIGGSSLTDPRLPVPEDSPAPGQIPSTYVPFRNANLLAIAVAWGESLGATAVFIGVHAADNSYPDCRPEFIDAFNRLVALGTRAGARLGVQAPLIGCTKAEIVRQGLALDAPFALTWSCYQSQDLACGRCHSCRLRLQAFRAAGSPDPLPYARRADEQ